MRASASSMQDILRGMKFPMRKEQILESVRKQNVSDDIIKQIELIPDEEYRSADELRQAIDSASQQAGGGGGGEVSHSVDPGMLEPERAALRMEEAARVSEGEEENKPLICKLLIRSFDLRNLRLKNNEKTMKEYFKNGMRLTEDWIYPQYIYE